MGFLYIFKNLRINQVLSSQDCPLLLCSDALYFCLWHIMEYLIPYCLFRNQDLKSNISYLALLGMCHPSYIVNTLGLWSAFITEGLYSAFTVV